jgi:hypothetical protein
LVAKHGSTMKKLIKIHVCVYNLYQYAREVLFVPDESTDYAREQLLASQRVNRKLKPLQHSANSLITVAVQFLL